MLDTVHKVMLQAVARGSAPTGEPPPALQRLEAVGLAARAPDGTWAITDTGRVALGPDPTGEGNDLKSKIAAWFTT